jgi:hypothetical protein
VVKYECLERIDLLLTDRYYIFAAVGFPAILSRQLSSYQGSQRRFIWVCSMNDNTVTRYEVCLNCVGIYPEGTEHNCYNKQHGIIAGYRQTTGTIASDYSKPKHKYSPYSLPEKAVEKEQPFALIPPAEPATTDNTPQPVLEPSEAPVAPDLATSVSDYLVAQTVNVGLAVKSLPADNLIPPAIVLASNEVVTNNPIPIKRPHADLMYIYFIQPKMGGLIKIGKTHNLRKRFETIQFMCPIPLKVITYLLAPQEVESDLHRRFEIDRRHGEWFHPSAELLDYISQVKKMAKEEKELPE